MRTQYNDKILGRHADYKYPVEFTGIHNNPVFLIGGEPGVMVEFWGPSQRPDRIGVEVLLSTARFPRSIRRSVLLRYVRRFSPKTTMMFCAEEESANFTAISIPK
jgi:hypothetical protein